MADDIQNTNPETNTHPEENGTQETGRMFTQDEVNNIVRDRLYRERERSSAQLEERERSLAARESRLECADALKQAGVDSRLLDVLDTSDPEKFKSTLDILLDCFQSPNRGQMSWGIRHGSSEKSNADVSKCFSPGGDQHSPKKLPSYYLR